MFQKLVPKCASSSNLVYAPSCVKGLIEHTEGTKMQEVLAVNIPEAARRLGLSTRTVAALVSRQELPSRKVGRRRIIPVEAVEAFLKDDYGPTPNVGAEGKVDSSE